MTKLEEKLIDLGYMQDFQNQYIYIKFKGMCNIYAGLSKDKKECHLYLDDIEVINNEKELNILFQEYNIMKQDLEELKQCQN